VQDLTNLIGQLPIGVWVASLPSGQVAYTNAAFQAILGVSASASSEIEDAPATYGIFDRTGKPYPVEDLPFSRVVRAGEPVVVDDLVIRRPDGTRVNVRAFAHPLRSETGVLRHVCIAFIDITREVRAELERDRASAQVSFAVDHSPIVIWTTDLSGRITLSQGAGLESLGVRSGELIGHSVFELYRDHPTIGDYLRRALAGESLQYVVEVGDAAFDTWITPLRDPAGHIVGVTGLSHDIRELRRLQALSAQTDRTAALGTLAASVAHEINNPLTYILSYADQVEGALDELDRLCAQPSAENAARLRALLGTLREDLQTLQLGTERIAAITRELRSFHHPDDRVIVPTDARAAVRSTLQLVRKELEGRAKLSLDLGETTLIAAHPARLVQVVLNLVMNAMQSLPQAPAYQHEIGITTATRGDRVVIEVSDTGPGVPEAQRERIFEPFFTTKPLGEGTGLGLFVCRNIVRAYAGDVSVQDRPGGGALFRVELPIPRGALAPEPAPAAHPAPPALRAHVLIIDDDQQITSALCGQLQRAGYRASACSTGAAGLRRILTGADIDLVFCDLMMTGVSGMDLYSQLLDRDPALLHKIVFMTGGACSPSARQFMLEHPALVVEKPFDLIAETDRRLAPASSSRTAPH
jgi:signal transduction histidine kinase